MKPNTRRRVFSCLEACIAFLLIAAISPVAQAATIWNGPIITYSQPTADPTQAANQDRLTDKVWLTRANRDRLFNAKSESACNRVVSPIDTEWASGTLANHASLTYRSFNSWVSSLAGGQHVNEKIVNVDAVLHLKSEDIYLAIKFTAWTPFGGGGFAYERSTPAAAPPTPSVTITNLSSGAIFAAPANITISANATVSSGSVTNVAFFANGTLVGSDPTAPFSITTSGLAANAYSLTAVATAAGVSGTSAPVNITVVSPVTVSVSSPNVANGQFSFSYSADPGLRYVVQSSSDLINWTPVVTNVASGNPVPFTDNFISIGSRYYRVGRLPNP